MDIKSSDRLEFFNYFHHQDKVIYDTYWKCHSGYTF